MQVNVVDVNRPGVRTPRRKRIGLLSQAILVVFVIASGFALIPTTASAAAVPAAPDAGLTFQVRWKGRAFQATLPANSVATYKWSGAGSQIQSWLTTASYDYLHNPLAPQPDLAFGPDGGTSPNVDVDPTQKFQTIDGFGGALTYAAAKNILQSGRRESIMNTFFRVSGARLNLVRITMGASDFDEHLTSYDQTWNDYSLRNFSIERDNAYVIPVLEQALSINPSLKILATPWSAPGWLKVNNKFVPGVCPKAEQAQNYPSNHLKNDSKTYSTYAAYFVKFLQRYSENRIPVWAVSMQNEPQNCQPDYPTMNMDVGEQTAFAQVLRPALDNAGFSGVTILGYDHNWYDQISSTPTTYPRTLLQQGAPVAAIGYHCYNGTDPGQLGAATQADLGANGLHPAVYMTECSGFDRFPHPTQNLVNEIRNDLIDPIRTRHEGRSTGTWHWMRSVNRIREVAQIVAGW